MQDAGQQRKGAERAAHQASGATAHGGAGLCRRGATGPAVGSVSKRSPHVARGERSCCARQSGAARGPTRQEQRHARVQPRCSRRTCVVQAAVEAAGRTSSAAPPPLGGTACCRRKSSRVGARTGRLQRSAESIPDGLCKLVRAAWPNDTTTARSANVAERAVDPVIRAIHQSALRVSISSDAQQNKAMTQGLTTPSTWRLVTKDCVARAAKAEVPLTQPSSRASKRSGASNLRLLVRSWREDGLRHSAAGCAAVPSRVVTHVLLQRRHERA